MMSRIYKIGSDQRNDVVLEHSSISDFHAEIYLDPQNNCFFTDLNSDKGSKINGEKVFQPTLLHPGDLLVLGSNQKFDWELIFFNRKSVAHQTTKKAPTEERKPVVKVKESSLELSFVQRNLDLIIIFGGILFFMLLLNWIM